MSRPAPASPLELMRMERDAWRREALANREEVRELRLLVGVYGAWIERYARWRAARRAS